MKLDKKGWGTREMIAISGILFFLLLIVTYNIYVFYHNIDSSHYYTLESNLIDAAREYSEKSGNNKGQISSDYLISNGYLDPLYDVEGRKCEGHVVFENDDYQAYLSCENYQTSK